MSKQRIVITGVGVVAPNGSGRDNFWKALETGQSGIARIQSFDPSKLTAQIAGEVDNADIQPWIDEKRARRIDRNTQLALVASHQAIQDSGLNLSAGLNENMGIVLGTAAGGQQFMLAQDKVLVAKGPMRISPFTALNSFPDACASQMAMELGLRGPSFAVSTACSSALDAIGISLDLIRSGRMEAVLTGGTEAPVCEPIVAAFCVARALSTNNKNPQTASRPFDKTRNGFVMSEGAGMLVLEDYESAKKRGAHIYAEILGHGMTCDAHHITAPDPEGTQAVRAVRLALKSAGISEDEVDAINAHGTSTPFNDKTETMIIKKVFKDRARKIPITAMKSMIGHLIGAAGSVELIGSILGMQKDVIPPTINHGTPDPECDLDYVPNEARRKKVKTLLKNSFGFGGKNSALIVRKV